ncbi:MAG: PEP-CTERM sorting domain-containing protein [Phycisphaeraceae bacterium]|nr:PEP-CTERM sorting domain-containing protein [Phycisphaeraceae bacterium]
MFGTSTVPEPNSLALLGFGGLLVASRRWRG